MKNFFKEEIQKGLSSCELLTLIYIAFTTVLIGVFWQEMDNAATLLETRAAVLGTMVVLYALHCWKPCRALWLVRSIWLLLALSFWYPETYQFARQLPYLDHVFANADWTLFGCQPSIVFSRVVPSVFWCEAFNMGYYSYYFMMFGVMLFVFLRRFEQSERYAFIFLGSFFLYYVIFELMPVAGPYYYFKFIGLEAAESGHYPPVGHYFATHGELIHVEVKGIFSQLVHDIQVAGENPVGAFPSSHVGMGTVTMLIAWHTRNRWLFWCLMPLYVLLCIATVYIMAHYLVDTLCGLLSACLFYVLMDWIYTKCFQRR